MINKISIDKVFIQALNQNELLRMISEKIDSFRISTHIPRIVGTFCTRTMGQKLLQLSSQRNSVLEHGYMQLFSGTLFFRDGNCNRVCPQVKKMFRPSLNGNQIRP